jgi:hypothetical protein
MLTDHSIGQYALHLAEAVDKEFAGLSQNRKEAIAGDLAIQVVEVKEECRDAVAS